MLSGTFGTARTFPIVLCCTLSACAINDPLTLDRAGDPKSLENIAFVTADGDVVDAITTRFRNDVIAAFAKRGIATSDAATAVVDLSVSYRDAEVAILANEQAQGETNAFVLKSESREGKWYERCQAKRLSATLAIFDRKSGIIDYRATAKSDHCEGDRPAVTELAHLLVADAMGEAPASE